MTASVFQDRADAGRQLAARLTDLHGRDVVVLGLPRGGVPVAAEVAAALSAPLDVIVVRKLGVPGQPELAMGAIGERGIRVLDADILRAAAVSPEQLARVEAREHERLAARLSFLRRGRPPLRLHGRTAVVVDDGVATGSTARTACRVARGLGAARVVLAVPVAPADTLRRIQAAGEADEVVCLSTPSPFRAVGRHYRDFAPVGDDDVIVTLDTAGRRLALPDRSAGTDPQEEVGIPAPGVQLPAQLRRPESTTALVIFAHGSGSSRFSPRNQFVASVLVRAGIGTLLMDLLTPAEAGERAQVFDIHLLAGRLAAATRWVRQRPDLAASRVGYFGASTGAGAALYAAAEEGADVAAVVCRGGRPDLAGDRLGLVRSPTLLLVGGADTSVLELNRRALEVLRCPAELQVVPGASHLFEEPGTLAEAALLARDWFERFLLPAGRRDQTPEPGDVGPGRGRR